MRSREQLKEGILTLLDYHKPNIVETEKIKKLMNVKAEEQQEFDAAMNELLENNKIKRFISLP